MRRRVPSSCRGSISRCSGPLSPATDPHFSWDTHWVGDFDLVDYVYGRFTFIADYQAILGEEFRPFDPYQSIYYLSASASYRRASNEWALVFHHVSRHLGDRPKRDPVAMNAWIVRLLKHIDRGSETIDFKGDIGPVVARAWVDYTWLGTVDVTVRHPLRPSMALYGRGIGQTYGVDEEIAGRGQQWGGRLEAGATTQGGRRRDGTLRRLRADDRRRSSGPNHPAVGAGGISTDGNVMRRPVGKRP